MRTQSKSAMVVVILLLLPLLYVGSYLGLVLPQGTIVNRSQRLSSLPAAPNVTVSHFVNYRLGGPGAGWLYWPLENVDRRLRPRSWRGSPYRSRTHETTAS